MRSHVTRLSWWWSHDGGLSEACGSGTDWFREHAQCVRMEFSTVACPRSQHGAKVSPLKTNGWSNCKGTLLLCICFCWNWHKAVCIFEARVEGCALGLNSSGLSLNVFVFHGQSALSVLMWLCSILCLVGYLIVCWLSFITGPLSCAHEKIEYSPTAPDPDLIQLPKYNTSW